VIYRTQIFYSILTIQSTDSDISLSTRDNKNNFQNKNYTQRENNIQKNQNRISDFADLFKQISTQLYNISQIIDNILNRSCFDFDKISPESLSGLNI